MDLDSTRQTHPRGFTLVELLIVVVILGVIAAIAVPQFSSNTEDAKLSQLQANLHVMREVVERYHLQHSGFYPGAQKTDGSAIMLASAVQARNAFYDQLTLYTSSKGGTASVRDATFCYGPYLREIPVNPFNGLNTVKCNMTDDGFSGVVADGSSGWLFFVKTGVIRANDAAHVDE